MNEKIRSLEMYKTDKGFEIYSNAVDEIGLWKSEEMIIKKYCKDLNTRILDLGCGCGRTTFGLYKIGYKNIVGLDLCDRFIDYARERVKKENLDIQFIIGDSSQLELEENSFDLVFYSFNGLQLIPGYDNRANVLKESYCLLKNGGYMIFTAHDREVEMFKDFWSQEKEKWDKGLNSKDAELFGDMYIYENGGTGFIHYSSIDELKNFIFTNSKFKIVEYLNRSDIIDESEQIKNWSSDTVFWVLRKEI